LSNFGFKVYARILTRGPELVTYGMLDSETCGESLQLAVGTAGQRVSPYVP
jgi:hypothetical protein